MRYVGYSRGFHDGGLAIIEEDGTVSYASNSERFTKIKYDATLAPELESMIKNDDYLVFYQDLKTSSQKYYNELKDITKVFSMEDTSGKSMAFHRDNFNFSFETYDPFKASTIESLSNLEEFKIITLHVPLTKNPPHETYNFVDKNFLNELKNESIIINTSRGGVLSESDFLKFDNLTVISDVFLNEPTIDKNFHQKNFISTPHIAGHTKSSRFDMTKMSLEKLINFFFNKKLNDSLVKKPYKKKSIHFSLSEVENDLNRYGFPVSLLLQIYDPRNDKFDLIDFADVRNAYHHRLGYEDITSNNDLNVSEYLFELGIE